MDEYLGVPSSKPDYKMEILKSTSSSHPENEYGLTFEEELRCQRNKTHYVPYKRSHHLRSVLKSFLGLHDFPESLDMARLQKEFSQWDFKHPKTLIVLKSYFRYIRQPQCYKCLFQIAKINDGYHLSLPGDMIYEVDRVFAKLERLFDSSKLRKNFFCYPLLMELLLKAMNIHIPYEVPTIKNNAKKKEMTRLLHTWFNSILSIN